MKVNITVKPYDGNTNTKAFVVLKLDDHLIIKGITLVSGKKGDFISFPAKKGKDENYYNSVYSLDKKWIKQLTKAVIKKYEEVIDSQKNNGGDFN